MKKIYIKYKTTRKEQITLSLILYYTMLCISYVCISYIFLKKYNSIIIINNDYLNITS
jgi:hypothetical protein